MKFAVFIVTTLACAGPAIVGTATSKGSFELDGSTVGGNATLLAGASIETSTSSSSVHLNGGVAVVLAPGSKGGFFADRAVLEKGSERLSGPARFRVEARGLSILADGPGSAANVRLAGETRVQVTALSGSFDVFNARGTLVAKVFPDEALELEPQASEFFAMVSGCLHQVGLHFLLVDETTNVIVELGGAGLEKETSNRISISGSAEPQTKPVFGATQFLRIMSLRRLRKGCGSNNRAAAAAIGAGAATGGAASAGGAGAGGAAGGAAAGGGRGRWRRRRRRCGRWNRGSRFCCDRGRSRRGRDSRRFGRRRGSAGSRPVADHQPIAMLVLRLITLCGLVIATATAVRFVSAEGAGMPASPYASDRWIDLGLKQEQEGNLAGAEKSLLYAAQIDRRYQPAWTLANFEFRRGNDPSFWRWARRAASFEAGELAPVLHLADAVDPKQVLQRLGDTPRIEAAYLDFLIRQDRLKEGQGVAMRILDRRSPADDPRLLDFAERQIRAGNGQEAMAIWRGLPPQQRIGRGFDWRVPEPARPIVEWRDSSLTASLAVSFDAGPLLERIVLAERQRYRVYYEYSTVGMPSPTGIRWSLGDQESPPLIPSDSWRDGSCEFAAGVQGLTQLRLIYRRDLGTVRAEGNISFRNLRLEAQ